VAISLRTHFQEASGVVPPRDRVVCLVFHLHDGSMDWQKGCLDGLPATRRVRANGPNQNPAREQAGAGKPIAAHGFCNNRLYSM